MTSLRKMCIYDKVREIYAFSLNMKQGIYISKNKLERQFIDIRI